MKKLSEKNSDKREKEEHLGSTGVKNLEVKDDSSGQRKTQARREDCGQKREFLNQVQLI